MKKSWIPRAVLSALLLLVLTATALADIPGPNARNNRNPKSNPTLKTEMRIATDEKTKEAKLIIPRSVFRQMSAQLEGNDSQMGAASARFFNMSGTQTIISGLFLSLAFAFGGVWLVRSRKGTERTARAALLAVALLLAGGVTAGIAYANAGPPPEGRSLTSKILSRELEWWGAYGQVKVEITDEEGAGITLVLPRTKAKTE